MNSMNKIFSSATKIVFIIMAIATVALTFTGTVEAKDFIMLVGMTFTYYYTKQQNPTVG